jgi:hypothetical protein
MNLKTLALVAAFAAAFTATAHAEESLLQDKGSHAYSCTVDAGSNPIFPVKGSAILVIDGSDETAGVKTTGIVDGSGRHADDFKQVYNLSAHVGDIVDWDQVNGRANGTLSAGENGVYRMMTNITTIGWPNSVKTRACSAPYYGVFNCNEVDYGKGLAALAG